MHIGNDMKSYSFKEKPPTSPVWYVLISILVVVLLSVNGVIA